MTLPNWYRSAWNSVSVAIRAADLYHDKEIGDLAIRPNSWSVYAISEKLVHPDAE